VGQSEPTATTKMFGQYLRRIREERKISLDAVEELTIGYPERVTKSHLSRIENGQAEPTFPRMFALSQVYGVPIASMAEKFELDLHRGMARPELADRSLKELRQELSRLRKVGDYREILALSSAAIERCRGRSLRREVASDLVEVRLHLINALVHLNRFESAKVDCEELLNSKELSAEQRAQAMLSFINCCYRLGRYTIAQMAVEEVSRNLARDSLPPRIGALVAHARGAVQYSMGALKDAAAAFEESVRLFEAVPEPFEVCRNLANLGQVLIDGRSYAKALRFLSRAQHMAENSGYDRLLGLSLSNLAVLHYKKGDMTKAESYALRSNSVARAHEYYGMVFRNAYYLRSIAADRGDTTAVRTHEKTLRTYLGRTDPGLQEAEEYRMELARSAQ